MDIAASDVANQKLNEALTSLRNAKKMKVT